MPDLFTTRADSHAVASPCVAVCAMNPANDFCDGCQRTIDEIAAWSTMNNQAKRQVWARIGERRARAATLGAQPAVSSQNDDPKAKADL